MTQKRGRIAALVVVLLALACARVGLAADPVRLFVAPEGKPAWSGGLPAPAPDGSNGPLPSIEAARDRIRQRRAAGEWKDVPITVAIRGGTYYLSAPLRFGPEDGGSAEAAVTYAAYEHERVVISGGRRISGWQELAGTKAGVDKAETVWVAELPWLRDGPYFTQLFVNGRRAPRTRLPKDGYYTFSGLPTATTQTAWQEGQDQATFKPGEIRTWKNLADVEAVALTLWIDNRLPLAAVDEAANLVRFGKKSQFRLTNTHAPNDFSRYWLENVRDALDTPGQWYLDRSESKLYYLPRPGETIENTEVVAPVLPELVRVEGKPDGSAPAMNISFRELSFQHAEWVLPAGSAGASQASNNVPGAVTFVRAGRCALTHCAVEHVAGYAVELGAGCENTLLDNCILADLGAGGVKIGHDTAHSRVLDCEIGPGGAIHHAAVGVWIGNSGHNIVAHNHIHDLYYTGVSAGWSWGYGGSKATHNIVEYNHIHDIGKGMLADMGGIYTLGVSPGTVLRYNRIHDITANGYGGWGIYNDEGSTGIVIENNVVYRTTHGGYHQHYGKENVVRNNVFAFARNGQIIRTRPEEHISFIFENNIVYFSEGPLLGSNWSGDKYKIDSNLYWRTDGGKLEFAGLPLEQWRARGHDLKSLIADPLFVAPDEGDFSLKPGSPAWRIGFQPINTSGIGRSKP